MSASMRVAVFALVLGFTLNPGAAFGQQTSGSPASPAPTPAGPGQASPAPQDLSEYPIGPKDLIEVRVLEIPDLNVDRRVSDAGNIALPLLGDFAVGGLTPGQARLKLETLLKQKYVNRANVSIIVKESASKPVSVVGAVRAPGSLNISGRWTLLQAISAVGGITENAGKKIYVLRRADNGLSDMLEVDTEELFRNSNPMWNIPIVPGDVVNVAPRRTIRIFCLGEFKSPGSLEFSSDDRVSLLSVVAKAGGLTDRASFKIRIKRKAADGKDTEIIVNYGRVLSGKDRDPILEANDVIVVKESFL
ncbi:MAG: polysaccharide biosynthesis/export family protein [Acidobacteriota bacterium]|nr:polysaccharide biosynthesis/export family protein [Acidobacteriota bacterium]